MSESYPGNASSPIAIAYADILYTHRSLTRCRAIIHIGLSIPPQTHSKPNDLPPPTPSRLDSALHLQSIHPPSGLLHRRICQPRLPADPNASRVSSFIVKETVSVWPDHQQGIHIRVAYSSPHRECVLTKRRLCSCRLFCINDTFNLVLRV